MASYHRARGRLSVRSLLVLLVALLIVSPLGQAGARRVLQAGPSESPAVGGSQVTTQGISDLPDGEIVYRVVKRTAPARGGAKVGRRVLSIVLATDDPILLSNEREDGTIVDIARVAPGESYLVQDGTRQIRSSLTDEPVEYLAVEIVGAASGPKIGNGELQFLSDPFTAPDGPRDIDFVRNILSGDDTGLIPDSGSTVAILATDGAIDILPANGPSTTLQAGESAIFPAGDLEITAATATANGVPTNQLAGLTSSLQTTPGDAAYVVTVIGEEVPPTRAKPSATSAGGDASTAPVPTTVSRPDASATPEPAASSKGTIGVQGFACLTPAGPSFDPTSCTPRPTGYSASITGGGRTFALSDAIPSDDAYFWAGLPLGAYTLSVDPLPEGVAGYLVPPGEGITGSPETGYTVTLSEIRPTVNVSIYFYPATAIVPTPTSTPAPVGVTVNITFSECGGYDPTLGPTDCLPVPAGSVNQPYLRRADTGTVPPVSGAVGNVYTWASLPVGGYDVLMSQSTYDFVIDGSYLNAGQGYRIVLSEFPFNLQMYAIRPPVIQ